MWHPLFSRTCKQCETYLYSADGTLSLDYKGDPRPRAPGTPTPCGTCPKVPEHVKKATDDWRERKARAEELSEANQKAHRFYRECRAVGRFPDDPLVRWYAGIIRTVEDAFERARQDEANFTLATIATFIKVRAEHGG